jgi:hypothetical protein
VEIDVPGRNLPSHPGERTTGVRRWIRLRCSTQEVNARHDAAPVLVGSQTQEPLPAARLFDPLAYRSLPGPERSFGVSEGLVRSYFHRQGPVAVNALVRSGCRAARGGR